MAHLRHMLVASDLTGRSAYTLQRALQLKAELDSQLTVLPWCSHYQQQDHAGQVRVANNTP